MKSENNEQKYLTLLEEVINQDDDIKDIIKFLEEAYVEDKVWVQNKVEYIYTNGNVDDFLKNIKNEVLTDFINSDSKIIESLYTNILKNIQSNIDKKNIESLIERKIKDTTYDKNVTVLDKIEQLVEIERIIKRDNFYTIFCKSFKYRYFDYISNISKKVKEKEELIEDDQQIDLILKNIEQNEHIIKIRNEIKLIQEKIKENEIESEQRKQMYGISGLKIKYTKDRSENDNEKIIKELQLSKMNFFNDEIEKINELKKYLEENYNDMNTYIYTELNYEVNEQQLKIFEEIAARTELNNIYNKYLKEKYNNLEEELNNQSLKQLEPFQNIKKKYFKDKTNNYYKVMERFRLMNNFEKVQIQEAIDKLKKEYEDMNNAEIEKDLEKVIENIHITTDANINELEFLKETDKIIKNIEIENFKKILSYNIISINENHNNKLENIYQLYYNLYEKIKLENKNKNIEEENNKQKLYRIEDNTFSWIINNSEKLYRNEELYFEIQREFEREFEIEFIYSEYTEREFRRKFNRVRDRLHINSNEILWNRDEVERILNRIYKRILSNPINNTISRDKENYIELKKDIIIEKLKLIFDIYIYIKLREYLLNRDNEKIIELAKKLKKEEYGWKEYGLSAYLNSRK